MGPVSLVEGDFVDRPLLDLAVHRARGRAVEREGARLRRNVPKYSILGEVKSRDFVSNTQNMGVEERVRVRQHNVEDVFDFDRIFACGNELAKLESLSSAERMAGQGRIIDNIIGSYNSDAQTVLNTAKDAGGLKSDMRLKWI